MLMLCVDVYPTKAQRPQRKFSTFKEAASEAAVSRFYGGIHFMDEITEGQKTGKEIGRYVLNKYFKR